MYRKSIVYVVAGGGLIISILTLALALKINKKAHTDKIVQTMQETEKFMQWEEGDDVRILADTDNGKVSSAPMVAKVGYEIAFNVLGLQEEDTLKVIGSQGYVQHPQKEGMKFIWVPERTGVFQVLVIDAEGNEKCSRNINVSDIEGGNAYQLNALETHVNETGEVTFSTSIYSTPTNMSGEKAQPVTSFSIGEAGIWSKMVKTYDNAETQIVEGKDFILDRGNYAVRAALRDQYSIEDEDYKNIEFLKTPRDGHKVVIHGIDHTVTNNENGSTSDKFIVNASCNEGCELVYAFFVSDSIGERRMTDDLNGYGESNIFTCPTTSWQYTFTARVKHKNNFTLEGHEEGIMLPNAVEAKDSIVIAGESRKHEVVALGHIEIEPFILKDFYENKPSKKQVIANNQNTGTVYAQNNNYITVYLDEKGEFEFAASVIDDGEVIKLESVENNNTSGVGHTFVYYPKSGGREGVAANPNETHQLMITVTELDDMGYSKRKLTKKLILDIK